MDYKIPFNDDAGEAALPIVYVRPVIVDDLPAEIRDQAEGIEILYAVHNEEGERLALVRGRGLAFELARQNDMTPVNVH